MDRGTDAMLLLWSLELSSEGLREQPQLVGVIGSAASMPQCMVSGVKDGLSDG